MLKSWYIHVAPLELEGAKLPLYKVAVQHLPIPRGRYMYVFIFY